MSPQRFPWLALALVAALFATALARPILPVDETRYAGVAWEMFARGDALVPWQNGETYSHKPPLLFWLMHAGWLAFGVNDWWLRVIPALFAAGCLLLIGRLARELWPDRPRTARIAPLVLGSCLLWTYFVGAVMFDMMIAFFVLLGWLGLARAWRSRDLRWFALYALGLGGGLMSKGPVALLHLLPAAIFAPLWIREAVPRWGRWYGAALLGVLGGAAIVLSWAVPAGLAGGEEYRHAIFLGQTAGRITESFAHRKPFWYYLPLLPLILAPWAIWPTLLAAMRASVWSETGARFALVAALVPLAGFSLISGKQPQYLLPEFAAFALAAAHALDTRAPAGARRRTFALPAGVLAAAGAVLALGATRVPGVAQGSAQWLGLVATGVFAIAVAVALVRRPPEGVESQVARLAIACAVSVGALQLATNPVLRIAYELRAVSGLIRDLQDRGVPVANAARYHGQFHFSGRLRQPLQVIDPAEVGAWLAANPSGRAVVYFREAGYSGPGTVEYQQPYRGQRLAVVAAAR